MSDARLVLEDGSVWKAKSFGASGTQVGEVVFNTSLTGYVFLWELSVHFYSKYHGTLAITVPFIYFRFHPESSSPQELVLFYFFSEKERCG